ncbi:phosphotransferase family protein [Nocardia sp. BMG51109]|uniref:phosphotransferase family protein n=1 Tax=Nocardia sp. BMG51109 TaxID=1056816 RepID=UPI000462F9BE|nr:phosphotransferase family protein [Nocardia sp. BMG51109]
MNADVCAGITRFLTAEFGGAVTVSNVRQLSVGARRRTLVFDLRRRRGWRRLVATIVPPAVERMPVEVEAAVRELARAHGVPVPPVVAVCTDTGYIGAPFVVSEHMDGETAPRQVLRLVHAADIGERVAYQLGQAMGRLHLVDPAAAPDRLSGAIDDDPAGAELAEVERGVRTVPADRPVFATALHWLEAGVPAPPERKTLLHNDMRNGNLIVDGDGLRAVLDWESARRFGDPMRDAAWAALRMWRFGTEAAEFGGFAGREPFVRGYETAGGQFDPDRFRWWKVLCTLGWGVGRAGAAYPDGAGRDNPRGGGRRIPEIERDLVTQIGSGDLPLR